MSAISGDDSLPRAQCRYIHLPGPATKAPIQWFFLVAFLSHRQDLTLLCCARVGPPLFETDARPSQGVSQAPARNRLMATKMVVCLTAARYNSWMYHSTVNLHARHAVLPAWCQRSWCAQCQNRVDPPTSRPRSWFSVGPFVQNGAVSRGARFQSLSQVDLNLGSAQFPWLQQWNRGGPSQRPLDHDILSLKINAIHGCRQVQSCTCRYTLSRASQSCRPVVVACEEWPTLRGGCSEFMVSTTV